MSESALGRIVPATRQKPGRLLDAPPRPPRPAPPGGVNIPAATDCARVIVVWSSFSAASASHEAAEATVAGTKTAKKTRAILTFIGAVPSSERVYQMLNESNPDEPPNHRNTRKRVYNARWNVACTAIDREIEVGDAGRSRNRGIFDRFAVPGDAWVAQTTGRRSWQGSGNCEISAHGVCQTVAVAPSLRIPPGHPVLRPPACLPLPKAAA